MEDGNLANIIEDNIPGVPLVHPYPGQKTVLAANGHDISAETPTTLNSLPSTVQNKAITEDQCRKRVNPLKIFLGKKPFVDNSLPPNITSQESRTVPTVNRPLDPSPVSKNCQPRAPRLIPKKKINRNQFKNALPNAGPANYSVDEQDTPVPRLVPKSQLLQFQKSASEKAYLNEAAKANLKPTVKYKCKKCCSMSFKTLSMLKEHQVTCRAQLKEPALSPQPVAPAAPSEPAGGSSRVTKKLYLCSACGTYYENWNLFLHMREVHNRHICLFCLGMFSKANKLAIHLANKHNVIDYSFDSKEDFCSVYDGTLYLMCCECDEICSEQDDFFNHDCNKVIPKPVPVLVSKKNNIMKKNRNSIDYSTPNGPSVLKEPKTFNTEIKLEQKQSRAPTPDIIKTSSTVTSQMCGYSNTSCDNIPENEMVVEKKHRNVAEHVENKINLETNFPSPSSIDHQPTYKGSNKSHVLNGDNDSYGSDSSTSPVPMDIDEPVTPYQVKLEPSLPNEKGNSGIKIKLCLNKDSSPVIINSTVDPSVGIQNTLKPTPKRKRQAKRFDLKDTLKQYPTMQPKTPSIKMTICDTSDSPFIKNTVYEKEEENALRNLFNNNMEALSKTLNSESNTLSTIYDNKMEELNTLNRVPKLTVKIPKELLDKDSSSDSSDSDTSDKLTVDEDKPPTSEVTQPAVPLTPAPCQIEPSSPQPESHQELAEKTDEDTELDVQTNTVIDHSTAEPESLNIDVEKVLEEPPPDEIPVIELTLNRPLDKYPLKELLKLFLASTVYNCIYCNHVRKIAVNCEQLSLHMATEHRFAATVDSITAEELMPETITAKLHAEAIECHTLFMNLDSYDSEEKCQNIHYDHLFECFQCYFKTGVHKDLYFHNRKMHQKTILLCVMCKTNFYSYSELLCHLCPGTYDSEYEIKFRCCLCNIDSIPSSFRLMVHLRKMHNVCDVCLEFCHSQARLSNHVWKHKLHHLCYRCGIAYRNKPDITKHLFWKHGTESVLCKKCLQKKWPHVYHFCTPPTVFVCDECSLQFTRAVYLKVHKRFHSGDHPHPCTEDDCEEKFVSKKLLMKHLEEHQRKLATVDLEEKKDKINEGTATTAIKEAIPTIDLVSDKNENVPESKLPVVKSEDNTEQFSKKSKKKKLKDKDALLLDVNLPELNLSESDSSDESDAENNQVKPVEGMSKPANIEADSKQDAVDEETNKTVIDTAAEVVKTDNITMDIDMEPQKEEIQAEEIKEEKPDTQQVLDIWDNFKKYQAKIEKPREKTPPLVPIRKHVCESDHDYCLIPANDEDMLSTGKKKSNKKKEKRGMSSSSSSSSSDSDSSCSCGSNCSCSSSSGSSSSSSDSESSDDATAAAGGRRRKPRARPDSVRRLSNGSNVDVMGMSETPLLVPEKVEPPINETDLDTNESDTDEEFYDEHPQKLANKLYAEKRNQLMLLASVAPSDGGSVSGEASRPPTPPVIQEVKEKPPSSKKKSKKEKKKKKSKSKKQEPIKINIPKDVIIPKLDLEYKPQLQPPLPNKITISLQANKVQIPETPPPMTTTPSAAISAPLGPPPPPPPQLQHMQHDSSKRASKRRRVPNKFYGYSSDEEPAPQHAALKPQLPPKLEWRKEDLPSPAPHRAKKEIPSPLITPKFSKYVEPFKLKAPVPGPEPPRILMNTESAGSSDSDSSDSGALEIYQPEKSPALPPPTYLTSGTSSLPYSFTRPAVRQAREGESVYCYCRCPYDEVSEMIACDADGCTIEWFHFECVGIMVPPKGKWYCPECRKKPSFSGYR